MMGLKFILTAVITLAMTMLHAAGNVSAAERSTDDPDAVVSEIPKAAKIKTPDEETIKKGELLTLQRCLEIALKRQPNIIAARKQSRTGKGELLSSVGCLVGLQQDSPGAHRNKPLIKCR